MVFPVDKTLKVSIKNDKHLECHMRFGTLGETQDAATG